ncbi:MAG TPA: flagellar hook-length control protein FliK [Thiobacillus sp.]
MNASAPNLNPVASTQAQTSKGKSSETASERPFSQVLSSEIAQKSRNAQTPRTEKTEANTSDVTDQADPLADTENTSAKPDPIQFAAAFDPLRTDNEIAVPEAFLALPVQLNQGAIETADQNDTLARKAQSLITDQQADQKPKKGPLAKALQAAQLDQAAAGSRKSDPSQPVQASSAFAGQLAAARQSDVLEKGDRLPELVATGLRSPAIDANQPTPHTGVASNRLAPSVGTAAWGQALGDKIVWMVGGAQQTASLTLNPPNLGPLQIVLNISNEQATASFFSAQPEVRQALEAAFPRLREMMSEAGIQLGQATVSADTPQQQAFEQPTQRATTSYSSSTEPVPLDMQATHTLPIRVGRGLVDTFA